MSETKLWHYTSFPSLLSMLQENAIYLTSIAALPDPFEGIFSETSVFRGILNDRKGFVHCWTIDEEESELFWRAYATLFGLAIESTSDKLHSALADNDGVQIQYSEICYWDRLEECTEAEAWARKPKWFRWEQEFRVHVPWHPGVADDVLTLNLNPKELISAVWLSPHAPGWMRKVVSTEMVNRGFNTDVVKTRRPPRFGSNKVVIELEDAELRELRHKAQADEAPVPDYIRRLIAEKMNW